MLRKSFLVLLVVAVSLLTVNRIAFGGKDQPTSSIRLQKWQFREERNGNGLLTLRLGNYGVRAVNVNAISLKKHHWTTVGRSIDPGNTQTLNYTVDNSPAYVEISTTEGKFRLELNPENESR